jgi:hypothetical protein
MKCALYVSRHTGARPGRFAGERLQLGEELLDATAQHDRRPLLHGEDKLHGWGSVPFIDGTLYQVRGCS